ncbi:MAG: hypothetical protein HRT55_07870 [Colwellia sp.]|uniref:hypothetical protein n=1 Tax=Alteromonadales TaxID=135622 RepID=UPI001DABC9A7|nr:MULTISPECIES: hypothetical protein [Alteromonadales]NQZ26216.1 hypothetical protein [Colwellia sp.]NRA80594.1 hypothetical protein [Pseudoalteromonas sp.]
MSKPLDKAVTVRFSKEDHLLLLQQSELRGCSVADMIRKSWAHYQQQQQIQQLLLRLEQRQRKNTFEMLSTTLGLKADERQHAMKQLHELGVKW